VTVPRTGRIRRLLSASVDFVAKSRAIDISTQGLVLQMQPQDRMVAIARGCPIRVALGQDSREPLGDIVGLQSLFSCWGLTGELQGCALDVNTASTSNLATFSVLRA
jgi:hypothetical protein